MTGRPREFDEDQVLDRAVEVFWRKGYEKTSLQDLVEHMGIGRQSLYNTFGDKRQLYLAALDRYCDRRAAAILGALREPGASRPALEAFLDGFVRVAEGKRSRACMVGCSSLEMAADDTDVEGRVGAHMRRMAEVFRIVIDHAIAKNELEPRLSAEAIAWSIVNAIYGIGVLGQGGVAPEAVRPVMDTIRASLGLGPSAVPSVGSA